VEDEFSLDDFREAISDFYDLTVKRLNNTSAPFTAVKPKQLDTGKAQNQAEDDFAVPKGGPYAGVPYWNELIAEDKKKDADGNVKEKPDYKPRYGECECGAEKTYGKDAPHSTWCTKYRSWK
jgi:hypothetical protein